MSGVTQWRRATGLVVGAGLLLGGCQGAATQRHAFPSTWPGSQPFAQDAPIVQVLPIQLSAPSAEASSSSSEGLPTAAVLSALFVKYLHVNGVNAILEPHQDEVARYLLQCDVPKLSYEVGEGYPKTRSYQAELACLLLDGQTRETLWKRQLTQRYEKSTLLDLMTKLPETVHEDDRTMYRECIVPLWDAMAQSVGSVVVSRQQAMPPVPPQGDAAEAHPQPETATHP